MTPWVLRLLAVNIGVFFLQQTLPGTTELFDFVPSQILFEPWTLVTYMFLHAGLGHLFANMLGLYMFGPRVEQRLGSKRFLQLFLVSGVAGGLLHFVFAGNPVVGASAAVFGVMYVFASFWPREQIYIWGILPVQVRWLVVIMITWSLWNGIGPGRGTTGVAEFAHLGGVAGAFFFLRWLKAVQGAGQFRKSVEARVPEKQLAKWRDVDLTRVHALNRDEVNRILDKISAHGIGSLTAVEKTFLSNFVPMDDRKPIA